MVYCLCCHTHSGSGEEVCAMDVVLSLMVTVVGGIMSHYIIKWLDSDHDDN